MNARIFGLAATFALSVFAGRASLATADDRAERTPAKIEGAVELELPDVHTPSESGGRATETWVATIDQRIRELPPTQSALIEHADPRLEARLGALLASGPSRTRTAVHVRDLDTGAVLFDHSGDRRLNPASNQKILTAVAAVELLGPDYVFSTRLSKHGRTLYLVGEGDPTLNAADLHQLADQIIAADALRGVDRIVVDESAFSAEHVGPGYTAEGRGLSYEAPSGALSLNFNTIEIRVRPSKALEPPHVEVRPESTHLELDVHARTGRLGGLEISTEPKGDETVVRIGGAIVGGHSPVKVRRRIADPALFTGGALAEILADLDASNTPLPVERGVTPDDATELARHDSAPLVEVLASAMKYSNNFTSEQVLRTLAWRATGEPGSWEGGRAVLERFHLALGGDPSALEVVNGSGLSRLGRITPRALVDLMALTHRAGSRASALRASMAKAGGEGTMRQRVTFSDGRVIAKTGTLAGATALSGIVASADGRRVVGFSILINGGHARSNRALQDRVVASIVRRLDGLGDPEPLEDSTATPDAHNEA